MEFFWLYKQIVGKKLVLFSKSYIKKVVKEGKINMYPMSRTLIKKGICY